MSSTPTPAVIGTCCACGYDGDEQTPCPKREDKEHCVHWWDIGEVDGPKELTP